MNSDLILCFNEATLNVLKTMAAVEAAAGSPTVKSDNLTWGEITGIIGMASTELKGTMAISFEREAILHIVNSMLMENYTEISADVKDAVGEITNMICGGAKQKLATKGYKFDMATPMILVGKGVELRQITKNPTTVLSYKVPNGGFVLEANLSENEATLT